MPRILAPIALLVLVLATAAFPARAARAPLCKATTVQDALIADGKLERSDVKDGRVVAQVRCGDVTADGVKDVTFAVASGGTAGNTRFGVLRGGATRRIVDYREGYKVGVARRGERSYEVLQPIYEADDPNCCPSSFSITRYGWNGTRFRAVGSKSVDEPPARFAG